MFRQTHTAQNAEMYNLVGWSPLRAYLRFAHKPGVNVLELPVYQGLEAGLARATQLTIDQSGKLLNVVFGLAYAAGIVALFRALVPAAAGTLPAFALVASTPLLFAISQWVLVDLLACALAVWALVLFHATGRASRKNVWAHAGLCAALALSFAIKPTVSVAAAPFYALMLWDGKRWRVKPAARFACAALGVAAGLAWFWYGNLLNARLGGHYRITDSAYYFGSYAFSPLWLGKLAGRLVLYVLGPGTLVALAFALTRARSSLRWRTTPLSIACVASFALYALAFLNLNVRHNYYQLPLLLPVGLALAAVVAAFARASRSAALVLALAVALNAGLALRNLLAVDRDLDSAIEALRHEIPSGIERPELTLVTDVDAAGPVLSYYLVRYVDGLPPEDVAGKRLSSPWFAACDLSAGGECRRIVSKRAPECADRGKQLGRYWVCVPNGGA
jgi:hypothetical protein